MSETSAAFSRPRPEPACRHLVRAASLAPALAALHSKLIYERLASGQVSSGLFISIPLEGCRLTSDSQQAMAALFRRLECCRSEAS